MARTTRELVEGVCELDSEIDLDPFIETANNIVTQVCLDSDYSDETLELIERWLSAHFYKCGKDPASQQEQAGKVSVTYQGRTYTGLRHSTWGQMAMLIDTAGNLKILDDNSKFKIKGSLWYVGGGST
jgi:hypothetical protein